MSLSTLTRAMLTLLIAAVTLAPSAQAAVAPYADWLFLLDRAKGDPAKVQALAEESPQLARIWFYGYIFDLSIPGISDREKARIRKHAEIIANVLAVAEPRDDVPLLLVEATPEALRGYFDSMQAMLNMALNDEYPVDAVIRATGTVTNELVPHAGFYALLHRADVANPRLGGRTDVRRRLEAARGLAEMLALVEGDMVPWQTLAAFRGDAEVRPDPATIPESRVCEGLNAIASDRPQSGRAAILDGRRAVGVAGASGLRITLLGLAPALIAERAGDDATARGGLAGAANRLPQPWMRALVLRRALQAATRAKDARTAIGLADTLRPILDTTRPDPADDIAIAQAIALWRAAGQAYVKAGDLEGAAQMLEPAARWTQWLRQPSRAGDTVPSMKRVQATRDRSAMAAEVGMVFGRLQLRLGQATSAVESFGASREMFLAAELPARAAVAELAVGEAKLRLGDLDASLEWASMALKALDGAPEDAARGLALRSEVRLRRGDLPPAYANANAGLRRLKAAGIDNPPLRARLHLLAAAALDADGQIDAARARLAFAQGVFDAPAVALALAESRSTVGAHARAIEALRAHAATPEGNVAAGCVEARAGQFAEAAARLAPMIDALQRDLDLAVRARACLAVAWIGLGKSRQAWTLGGLSAAEWAAVDPAEGWALHAALGAANAPDAATHRQAAIEAWRVARGDGHLLGLLDRRTQAMPHVGSTVAAVIEADLARDKPDWASSLPLSIWWRQTRLALSSVAPRPERDVKGNALRALRGEHLAARWQGRLIADPALQPAQREAAIATRAAAWQGVAASLKGRLAKARRWAAYAAPVPPNRAALAPEPGRAHLFIQTGPARSRAWLYLPGKSAPTFTNLPGRDALASLRLGVEGHLSAGLVFAHGAPDPHAQAWAQLMDAARTLLPGLSAAKSAAPPIIEVFADGGPLTFFPWGALVSALPNRGGAAPTFLVDRYQFVHRLTTGPSPDPAAEPQVTLLCAGECAPPMQTVVERTATRGGAVVRQSSPTITTPLAHLEGIVDADGVAIGGARSRFSDWARMGAKPFEIAVAGEVRAGRGRLTASLAHGGAQSIVLPVGSGPITAEGPLLDAWSAAVGRATVPVLVFTPGPAGNKFVNRATPIASAGAPLGESLHLTQRRMARAPAAIDAVPMHHPSQWARWLTVRP